MESLCKKRKKHLLELFLDLFVVSTDRFPNWSSRWWFSQSEPKILVEAHANNAIVIIFHNETVSFFDEFLESKSDLSVELGIRNFRLHVFVNHISFGEGVSQNAEMTICVREN